MAEQSIEVLIEGGKATAAPPLGPALGPMGVNIGQIVGDINKKTDSFKGMQVPVTVTVDSETKEYSITVGTPPASALIKKEAKIEKGAGNPLLDKVADLAIEQVIKVAIMKEDALLGKDLKMKVREVVGTCQSMGILVEGMEAQDALRAIAEGEYDTKIQNRKTELSEEELKELREEKKRLQEEMEQRKAEVAAMEAAAAEEAAAEELPEGVEPEEGELPITPAPGAPEPDESVEAPTSL